MPHTGVPENPSGGRTPVATNDQSLTPLSVHKESDLQCDESSTPRCDKLLKNSPQDEGSSEPEPQTCQGLPTPDPKRPRILVHDEEMELLEREDLFRNVIKPLEIVGQVDEFESSEANDGNEPVVPPNIDANPQPPGNPEISSPVCGEVGTRLTVFFFVLVIIGILIFFVTLPYQNWATEPYSNVTATPHIQAQNFTDKEV